MLKRVAVLSLAILFSVASLAVMPSQAVRPMQAEHLGELMEKLGTGETALVAVRLKNDTAIAGHVTQLGTDSFRMVNRDTGQEVTISYVLVDRMQGYNVTTGKEVHEGTGIRGKLARLALKSLPGHQVPQNKLLGTSTLIIGIIIGIILAIVLSKVL